MRSLAELAIRAPWRILALAVAFALVAGYVGRSTPGLLGGSDEFEARGSESARVDRLIERTTGFSATPQVLVLVRSRRALAATVAAVGADPWRGGVGTIRSLDGREWIVYAYGDSFGLRARLPPGTVLGGADVGTDQVDAQVRHDLAYAEKLAFPLLFLLALWVFRSVVAALLPLVCGALTILGALLELRLLHLATPVSTFALNIVTGAGLGLGIDYSLLLLSRFREELARDDDVHRAVRTTLATAGRTVAFSAVTVAAAIATLAIFPLGFLRSMGIAGGLVAPLAGLIALTVLPALFVVLGRRVNALAPRRWQRAAETAAVGGSGGWYALAHRIMRRPLPVAIGSAALLIVLGLPFLQIRFTGVDATVLPPQASSRVVEEALRHDFAPQAAFAAYAVVRGDPAGYVRRVRELPHAAAVAPPQPIGAGLSVVRVSAGAPFLAERSQQLVRELRRLDAPVGGSTARFVDQKAALASHLPPAVAILCAVTFLLLLAATRSLVLPLKALLMNLLTISAAFGILVLVFQDGRLEGVLDYRGQGALELTQPILLFAIAFGLSTDYGIFLLTRIKEAWDAGLPNREAIAVGLERTGRIVTAAALLFCVAVASFATSKIVFVKEVGLGIALAVAIDATIVRALLVPSLMALLGRWNWWPGGHRGAAAPRTAAARSFRRPRSRP